MFKKIMMAALAVGALALNAPVASADPGPAYDCGFDSSQQEDVTGQAYEGVIYGYIVHPGDSSASIRCYITVNGADVGADVTASGPSGGANAARISFSAADTDAVNICWTATTSHGSTSGCAESTHTQIPPQAVIDLLDQVFAATGAVDPLLCPLLGGFAGSYGPITITSYGDVSVDPLGGIWDCPPYGA